jgi:hypothetical protein
VKAQYLLIESPFRICLIAHNILLVHVHSLTPDRYVLNKYNNLLAYQDLHEQTHHFVRAEGAEGVSKHALLEPHKGPVLADVHLRVGCCTMNGKLTLFYTVHI